MAVDFLRVDDFREGIGVSEEQAKKIDEAMCENFENLKPIHNELAKLEAVHPNSLFADNVPEDAQTKYFELQAKMQEIMGENKIAIANESFTSEQMKKINEFQISFMSEFPIVSPGIFEALDLTDAQKKQLGDIKKAMEPEFEKFADTWVKGETLFEQKLLHELEEKLKDVTDPEEFVKIGREIMANLDKPDSECQQELREKLESARELADKIKIKMFDVLTDKQWDRMVQLVDNPPEYAKKAIAEFRKMLGRGGDEADESKTNDGKTDAGKTEEAKPSEWTPGPNSWKPGDPIPESYRQERNTRSRFPRTEIKMSEPQS
jgi:uncharacterized protein (DUF1778 family)